MQSQYGNYIAINKNNCEECLNLSFLPTSNNVKENWAPHQLSAGFLGDYCAEFFPDKKEVDALKIEEIKYAASYIANELLENAIKYNASECRLANSISLSMEKSTLIFSETTHLETSQVSEFIKYIEHFLASDPEELLLEQMEQCGIEDNESSGLGFLTMVNDYQAKLGWHFKEIDSKYTEVITQVTINF